MSEERGTCHFVITAVTGLAIKLFMPGGVRQGRLQEFLGIQKETWSGIHDWAGILLIVLVVIHLILHWNCIVCMTKNLFQANKNEDKNRKQSV